MVLQLSSSIDSASYWLLALNAATPTRRPRLGRALAAAGEEVRSTVRCRHITYFVLGRSLRCHNGWTKAAAWRTSRELFLRPELAAFIEAVRDSALRCIA